MQTLTRCTRTHTQCAHTRDPIMAARGEGGGRACEAGGTAAWVCEESLTGLCGRREVGSDINGGGGKERRRGWGCEE